MIKYESSESRYVDIFIKELVVIYLSIKHHLLLVKLCLSFEIYQLIIGI